MNANTRMQRLAFLNWRTGFLAVFILFWAQSALSTPLTWTFSGFTFADGGTATGSFIYDADTNTYSCQFYKNRQGKIPENESLIEVRQLKN